MVGKWLSGLSCSHSSSLVREFLPGSVPRTVPSASADRPHNVQSARIASSSRTSPVCQAALQATKQTHTTKSARLQSILPTGHAHTAPTTAPNRPLVEQLHVDLAVRGDTVHFRQQLLSNIHVRLVSTVPHPPPSSSRCLPSLA